MLSWLLHRRIAGIETSGISSDDDTATGKKRKVQTLRINEFIVSDVRSFICLLFCNLMRRELL